MISNVLTRVPSAGKIQSAAEVAAPSTAFRQGYTPKPSPTFRFTFSPIQTRSSQNCIRRTEDGVTVPGPSRIRLFQRQDHHSGEPYRIELPSSLQKYTKIDVSSFFLLCSLLTLCIYFFLTTVKIKTKRLPPGPTGLPVLGSLVTIGNRPHESLSKLAKTYGPLMTVKFGMIKIVVVSSAEMAREIFQKNDQAFSGRPAPEAVVAAQDYDMSMVWSSGLSPHWKKLRKICNSQLFTAQRLDASQELRQVMMQKMIEQVDEARHARQPLDVGWLVFGTTLNFLSNTMFSSDMFDMKSDATTELKELIGDLIELVGKPNVADYLPFLKPFDPQGIRRGLTLLYERLRRLLDGIIERRIKRRAFESERYGDFLDVLLDHTEEDGPQELNYQNISVLLMDLFLGGTHTTTTLLEWTMAELLHNPPILAEAKQELSNQIPPRQIITFGLMDGEL
ncbi:Geraniol 8-hydroxylase [Sesamum alatum]|uniref:Geraniol 8-hydroxylase n=1 Tax=Sesamum alatum TaxID=300844 RepID=A0AAE2CHW2_9LAMI|nr:Geraniol 8-hydroxylase [Sesamum alatum]